MNGGPRLQNMGGCPMAYNPDGWERLKWNGTPGSIAYVRWVGWEKFCFNNSFCFQTLLQARRTKRISIISSSEEEWPCLHIKPVRCDTYSVLDIRPWSTTTAEDQLDLQPVRKAVISLHICVPPHASSPSPDVQHRTDFVALPFQQTYISIFMNKL